MTFEEWRKEAEQMLVAWYCDDPASVDKDHWRQCFDCNYRPWEAARYTAELLHRLLRRSQAFLRTEESGRVFLKEPRPTKTLPAMG